MLRRIASRRRPTAAAAPGWGDPSTTPEDRAIIEAALPHTMTGPARLQALVDAVRYCVARGIEGAFAECGVWRGGSVLAMILTLQQLGAADRDLWLYDTFEGMTEPTEHDVSPVEAPALESWRAAGGRPYPELFSGDFGEEQVRRTLAATGYDERRLHFVAGPVERTLPERAPERLALLRLDTDWYESTRAEMEHLYPRLVSGGVLIVDDWGHWEGARRAVEEHLAAHGGPLLLHRIDYTARIGVKA
jgi:O-methyltransferase